MQVKHFSLVFLVAATFAANTTVAQNSASSDSASADAGSIVPPEMAARYAHAKWSYPASDQMADLYPDRAAEEAQPGVAVIACEIKPDGSLDPCIIGGEAPKEYGFGVATATLFVKFAHVDPATVDGGIQPGDFKVFTFKWEIS
jgi:hypothetical protein